MTACDPKQPVSFVSPLEADQTPMYFDDLSSFAAEPLGKPKDAVAVGWLENGYPFKTGPVPRALLSKLCKLAKDPKNPMWGFHECDICTTSWRKRPQGNGEIHVVGSDGTAYVAPTLIVHYIKAHNYLPPKDFVEAVLEN
jgi:hypothetical protein